MDNFFSSEHIGLRVDQGLCLLYPEYSRSQLTKWLRSGDLLINHTQNYKAKTIIKGGESVHLHVPEATISTILAESIPLDIIYEDEDCLIINKPAGLTVHPGAGQSSGTLLNAILHYLPTQERLPRGGLIHRLDKETSGLLIIAKSEIAYTDLIRQMQERKIQRHYYALVRGTISTPGTIETYFGRDPKNRLKMAVRPQGKIAITHYEPVDFYHQSTLLKVQLLTGRTHQIRVHLAHIKHPILGDPLYHPNPKWLLFSKEQQMQLSFFQRQALHAYQLIFTHPTRKMNLQYTAPIPADLQTLLDILSSWSAGRTESK